MVTEEEIRIKYPEYKPDRVGSNFKDRSGERHGKLTVLYRTYSDTIKNSRWVCKCDCGNYIAISATGLNKNHTQSCGCLQKERTSQAHKKFNNYDLQDEYGIGYLSNTHKAFIFDKEDFDKIKEFCWMENDNGYVISHNSDGKNIRLHRLILNPKDDEIVDHKNLNKLDNRKSNLRIATKQTNGINRPCNSNNQLGVKGVNLNSTKKKYIARIMKDGKTIHLGSYETIEEAAEVRRNKEKELFGDFAYEEIQQLS